MKSENKLVSLFQSKEEADKNKMPDQLVDDPRIESPEIKVVMPQDSELSKSETNTEPVVIKPLQTKEDVSEGQTNKTKEKETYDQGFLDELEVVAKKEDKAEEPHVCTVGFGEAFKQHWLAITGIIVAMGVLCFIAGRTSHKLIK